jgi:hypothetical protein
MRGERQLLRLGEYLVRRACQRLPRDTREEQYREWAAELPAILHDPQVRPAPRRAVRMLAYAADTLRGAALTPGRTGGRIPRVSGPLDLLFLAAAVVGVAFATWPVVQAPGDGLNYLRLAWGLLLVAALISKRVRSAARVTTLLAVASTLALVAVFLWGAAQAPGDWVNYVLAAWLLLLLLVLLLAWWLRIAMPARGRHNAEQGK